MNARTVIFDAEEWAITLSRWHRQSEALLLRRLYGAPEAGEEIGDDEDAAPEAPEPYVLSERQEAAEYEAEIEDNQRQYEEAE